MCLAVPGQIVSWIERDPIFASAEIDFGGVRRVCHMACVADAAVGDYVIVHAGVAISRIDATDAHRVLEDLRRLGEAEFSTEESDSS